MAERSETARSSGAAEALERGFAGLAQALQQGFDAGLAHRGQLDEAGRTVTLRGVDCLYAVLGEPDTDDDRGKETA
jgi:hypothetical protein